MRLPLERPSPDFDELAAVLKGDRSPRRVHFVEFAVDVEVIRYVVEHHLGHERPAPGDETPEDALRLQVEFFHRMGYDYVPMWATWRNVPRLNALSAADTAGLSRGNRSWVDEHGGVIAGWEDLEAVRWDDISYDLSALDYVAGILPDGMKMTVCGGVLFEMVLEVFLGYEGLFFLSQDEPELVEAVFERWGQKMLDCYREVVRHPAVGAIFHADDLGHKTGTLLSPAFLRKNVFPWFRKYASLAHSAGKMCWLHSCGNLSAIMDDLIDDVRVDALHSYQDVIMPVGEFVSRYGNRIAALGGIDVDGLCRLSEEELRLYVRHTLDMCLPGRYALGSGNTVANYIPPEHYLVMLDEGRRWTAS